MIAIKAGDRVVFIETIYVCSTDMLYLGKVGVVVEELDQILFSVMFDERKLFLNRKEMVLEDIYNSPLYKALNE